MTPATLEYDQIEALLGWFEAGHLPDEQRRVGESFAVLVAALAGSVPHNDEALVGFRKLLEARDCFVRATIAPVGLQKWVSKTRWSRGFVTEVP